MRIQVTSRAHASPQRPYRARRPHRTVQQSQGRGIDVHRFDSALSVQCSPPGTGGEARDVLQPRSHLRAEGRPVQRGPGGASTMHMAGSGTWLRTACHRRRSYRAAAARPGVTQGPAAPCRRRASGLRPPHALSDRCLWRGGDLWDEKERITHKAKVIASVARGCLRWVARSA